MKKFTLLFLGSIVIFMTARIYADGLHCQDAVLPGNKMCTTVAANCFQIHNSDSCSNHDAYDLNMRGTW